MLIATIQWRNKKVRIIDQVLLPRKAKFIDCNSAESIWRVIKRMNIRGAPAIGIAAAFGVYLGIRKSKEKTFFKDLHKVIRYLATFEAYCKESFLGIGKNEECSLHAQSQGS